MVEEKDISTGERVPSPTVGIAGKGPGEIDVGDLGVRFDGDGEGGDGLDRDVPTEDGVDGSEAVGECSILRLVGGRTEAVVTEESRAHGRTKVREGNSAGTGQRRVAVSVDLGVGLLNGCV